MTRPAEHDLTDYVLALGYDGMDEASRSFVSAVILDTVGIAVGAFAAGHRAGLICEDDLLACSPSGPSGPGLASLWSGRGGGFPEDVALCNGTWAEVLDYQDTVVDPRNNGHAAVTIVPAALAVAEAVHASGQDLIAAVAGGLEATLAILRAVGRNHRAEGRGFRTTSIAAPVGAALACAKLLGLDPSRALHAAGICGACTPCGLMPSLSPTSGLFGIDKDLANGIAAQLAVRSARFAAGGMTGSDAVVTGERGILASHAHGDALPLETPSGGTPNLRHVALKKIPACYGCHSAMEAAAWICANNGLTAADVERVTVAVKADSAETLSGRKITNHMAARFSLPYCVALAITRGSPGLADFEAPAIHDDAVLSLMTKIHLEPDVELTEFHRRTGGFPARVTVGAGGGRHERRVDYPLGSFQRPMTPADLEDKLTALTDGHWSEPRRRQVFDKSWRLAELDDVRELTALL